MHAQRPVDLAVTKFSFPLAAITSIAHRISGVVLFVGMGYFLYMLDRALASPEELARLREAIAAPSAKISLLCVLGALSFHVVAGLRHLLLDLHIGDSFQGGKRGAQATFAIAALLIVLAGLWIW